MKKVDETAYYTEDSEWIRAEGKYWKVGISDFAQEVYGTMEKAIPPLVESDFKKGTIFYHLETSKALSEVYMPLDGTIKQINEAVVHNPKLINESPYDQGWIAIIDIEDKSEIEKLMTAEVYRAYIGVLFNK